MVNKGVKRMKIDKDTQIGDILDNAPEKAKILLAIGMHCLGCPASRMETLEEACWVHGIDVEEVVEEMNKEHSDLADSVDFDMNNFDDTSSIWY